MGAFSTFLAMVTRSFLISHGGFIDESTTQLAKGTMGGPTGSTKINISMCTILGGKLRGLIPSNGFRVATNKTSFLDGVQSGSSSGEFSTLGTLVGLWWIWWNLLRRDLS